MVWFWIHGIPACVPICGVCGAAPVKGGPCISSTENSSWLSYPRRAISLLKTIWIVCFGHPIYFGRPWSTRWMILLGWMITQEMPMVSKRLSGPVMLIHVVRGWMISASWDHYDLLYFFFKKCKHNSSLFANTIFQEMQWCCVDFYPVSYLVFCGRILLDILGFFGMFICCGAHHLNDFLFFYFFLSLSNKDDQMSLIFVYKIFFFLKHGHVLSCF